MDRSDLHVSVASATSRAWRRAAYELGFRIDRSPRKGTGNVTKLLDAVAAGHVSAQALDQALAVARDGRADPP